MNHAELAALVLEAIRERPAEIPPIETDDTRRNNAARCMGELFCNRLSTIEQLPERIKHTTYEWCGGWITLRNSRIADHHWSTLQVKVAESLHQQAETRPVVYVLTYWAIDEGMLHVWAIPEDVADQAFSEIPLGKDGTYRTIEVFPDSHHVKKAPNAPDLSQFYTHVELLSEEVDKLVEAIKIDHVAKQIAPGSDSSDVDNEEDDISDDNLPFYTSASVEFIAELSDHIEDPKWHADQKLRYQRVLRDPTRSLVEAIRDKYIERLSPEVAGGKRPISILKKNDYGKGGYYDHYWFAFYDPNALSKTKSVQLFFHLLGSDQAWGYGFAMGSYCEEYLERFRSALLASHESVAAYVRQAPPETTVKLWSGEEESQLSVSEFADRIDSRSAEWLSGKLTNINILREFPLDSLAERDEGLVDEIGQFFMWAWPFFEASVTGVWPPKSSPGPDVTGDSDSAEEVDEEAPQTLGELSELTSLSNELLDELEQSLLAKQQTVLVGPPGTSKTYIARQFARYFVRQRAGRQQGSQHVLYMHANWTYEDFFEGIKPTTSSNGTLTFQPQKGFFLEWVEQLKSFDTSARHVLVLDEINRCDTAAVLGELLQLLEYRGTTVRLLSGRRFVFPRNLYIIGTMNSADRSIGRLDLALRRRFLWLSLNSQPDALQRWLNRVGNNPVGFKSSALVECNEMLAKRGIPPEQHVGHALFMVQESDTDDESGIAQDIPLSEKHLRRVVKFSVLPYIRELFRTQFGQDDESLIDGIRNVLLSCLDEKAGSATEISHDNV